MSRGRDALGRFTEGNSGGPGRPSREVELSYSAALREEVPLEEWRKICRKALEDALAGDHQARSWLSKQLIAPEARELEKLRKDAGAWQTFIGMGKTFAASGEDNDPLP